MQLSSSVAVSEEGVLANQDIICFGTGQGYYCLPIEMVLEIVEYRKPHPYPRVAEGHIGILNVRGQVYPVIGESLENSCWERFLVVQNSAQQIFCFATSQVAKIKVNPGFTAGDVLQSGDKSIIVTTPEAIWQLYCGGHDYVQPAS